MKQAIDRERCLRAMRNIQITGLPNSSGRLAMIEEAIRRIQQNPTGAMDKEYLGFKNYAAFGDQRSDCEYNMGPRHGSIVFSVGRVQRGDHKLIALGADEIYLLECVRDAGTIKRRRLQKQNYNDSEFIEGNLCGLLTDYQTVQKYAGEHERWFAILLVESEAAA